MTVAELIVALHGLDQEDDVVLHVHDGTAGDCTAIYHESESCLGGQPSYEHTVLSTDSNRREVTPLEIGGYTLERK